MSQVMPGISQNTKETGMAKAQHGPQRWGKLAADFYAGLQEQPVIVAVVGGQKFKGTLIGVDIYDILMRQETGLELLIGKGQIVYVHRGM